MLMVVTRSTWTCGSGAAGLLALNLILRQCAATPQGAIDFVEYVFNDKANQDTTVNKTAIALLGDLASTLTGQPLTPI